jgi:hypothetical protein
MYPEKKESIAAHSGLVRIVAAREEPEMRDAALRVTHLYRGKIVGQQFEERQQPRRWARAWPGLCGTARVMKAF